MSEEQPAIADERYVELFHVKRSVRYHNCRRQFFEGIDKFTTALSLIFGSGAAAAAIGQDTTIGATCGFAVAIASATSLVLSAAHNARDHHELSIRFGDLERKITSVPPEDATPQHITDWRIARREIDSDEPPTKSAIDVMMHNEVIQSGFSESTDKMHHIPWHARLFGHWLSYSGVTWETESEYRERKGLPGPVAA